MKKRYIFIIFCLIINIFSYIYLSYNSENTSLGIITTAIVVFTIVFSPLLLMIAIEEPEKESFKD